jgi:hypothetical protein
VAQSSADSKTSASIAAAGAGLGHAIRAIRGQQGKRLLGGLMAGGASMFGTFTKVLRLLMLQVLGFVFLVIAVAMGSKTWHEYQAYAAAQSSPSRFYVAASFCAVFTYFGISSFWRARK